MAAFLRNGRATVMSLCINPFSILFSRRRVITVRMFERLSNRFDVTWFSFWFTSFSVRINGLSKRAMIRTVALPMITAIVPNNGEKMMMAVTEKMNFVTV